MAPHSDNSGSDVALILLLGQTGVGKSTFINDAAGSYVSEVGSGIISCTKEIQGIPIPLSGHNVALVDTPGFNDTWNGDVQIFEKITGWLKKYYDKHPTHKFAGILYLYDISQARNVSQGDYMLNFQHFEDPPLVDNLHFVSTHWNPTKSQGVHEGRELELRQKCWKKMIQKGAQVSRFEENTGSARFIISQIVGKDPSSIPAVLQEFDAILQKVSVSSSKIPHKKIIGGFFSRLFRTPGAKPKA